LRNAIDAERSVREPLYIHSVTAPRKEEPTEGVIYVNWVRTLASPYDLSLDLGFATDPGPPQTFPVRAVMSWEEAKVLSALLTDAIEGYEENVGPIRDMGGEIVEAVDPDKLDEGGS
jgi:hypothetical protein